MKSRLHVLLVAMQTSIWALPMETAGVEPAGPAPRVAVSLILLDAPSGVQTTTDLSSLGTILGEPSQVAPGGTVFLEAWCQTPGPNGISTAVLDVSYDTTFLNTSVAQVIVAPQWDLLPFEVFVDDGVGFVDDFGGNNFSGVGVAPEWAKVGSVEFDVTSTAPNPAVFCSNFAGGFLKFAIRSEGAVDPEEVAYGCFMVGCGVDADCDDGNACTDDLCDPFAGCMTTANSDPCDDGDACTTDNTCSGGVCVGGVPPNCDDGNPCTDDSCDPATGCVTTANSDPCDDGDACTTADTCSGGACSGSPIDCNDGNVCTDDACDDSGECTHTRNEQCGACCNQATGICVDDSVRDDCLADQQVWHEGLPCDDPAVVCVACPQDLNGDGDIGPPDLASLLDHWDPCPEAPAECPWDFNGDGDVGPPDLASQLDTWGPCP